MFHPLILALAMFAGFGFAASASCSEDLPLSKPVPVGFAPVPKDPPAIGSRRLDLKKHGPPDVAHAELSADGSLLVVTGWEHVNPFVVHYVVTVWEAASGKHLHTHRVKEHIGGPPALSPDGKRLALPDERETLILDAATGKELLKLDSVGEEFRFSADGKMVATHDSDKLQVWNATTGKSLFSVAAVKDDGIQECQFASDGRLVFRTKAGNHRVWDPAAGKELAPAPFKTPGIVGPGGTLLVTTSGRPRLLDLANGKEVRVFGPVDSKFVTAALSQDGKLVVASTPTGRTMVWNASTGVEHASFTGPDFKIQNDQDGITQAPAITPDGKHVVLQWVEPSENFAGRPVHAVYSMDGREVRRVRSASVLNFDSAMRSVVVVTPSIPRFPDGVPDMSTVSVTIHDARAWFAEKPKKD